MTEQLKQTEQTPVDPVWVINALLEPVDGYPEPTGLEQKAANLIRSLIKQVEGLSESLTSACTQLQEMQEENDKLSDLCISMRAERNHLSDQLDMEIRYKEGIAKERDELRTKYNDTYEALDDAARECTKLRAELAAQTKAADHWMGEANKEHNDNLRLEAKLDRVITYCKEWEVMALDLREKLKQIEQNSVRLDMFSHTAAPKEPICWAEPDLSLIYFSEVSNPDQPTDTAIPLYRD